MHYNLNTNEKIIEMYGKKFFLGTFDDDFLRKVKNIDGKINSWKIIINDHLTKINQGFEIERVTEKDIILFIKLVKQGLE